MFCERIKKMKNVTLLSIDCDFDSVVVHSGKNENVQRKIFFAIL